MDNLMIPEERLDEDTPEMKRRQRYINKCRGSMEKMEKRVFGIPSRKAQYDG